MKGKTHQIESSPDRPNWTETDIQFVPNLGVWLEFAIIWPAAVTSDKSPVFVFDGILLGDIRVNDSPKMGFCCNA